MLHGFPRAHVTNLGGGTIGHIHLTRTDDGNVLLAEAKLHSAPFSHMVIDSPELLKMFKSPTEPVDLSVFDHPWPEFRLEPREPFKFDVARLERLQYVRSADKAGLTVKGHPYATAMDLTPSAPEIRRTSHSAAPVEVQSTRHSARKAPRISDAEPANVSDARLAIRTPKRTTSGGYTLATALDDATRATIQGEMDALKEQIFSLLTSEGQQTYDWVLWTGLKRQGKEGERFRNKVIETLKELMKAHEPRGKELLTLYNQYAEKQRTLEKRWPYHLPHIDNY